MDSLAFENLKRELRSGLDPDQLVDLERALGALVSDCMAEAVIARESDKPTIKCPHCKNFDVVKDGRDRKGRQRFWCRKRNGKGCNRSFNVLTGTPLARMRKAGLWYDFLAKDHVGRSLVKIARDLNISSRTAWRWRHRFLRLPMAMQAESLDGIIEIDETFLLDSFKGSRGWKRGNPPANRPPRYRGRYAAKEWTLSEQIPILMALDRTGGEVDVVLEGRSSKAIDKALENKIARGSVVCTDGLKSYPKVIKKAGAEHVVINPPDKGWLRKVLGGKPRKKGRLTLGRVNAQHERLKTFVNHRFRGVSTAYLPAYMGWLRQIRPGGFKAKDYLERPIAKRP